jgi:hypothetical protein
MRAPVTALLLAAAPAAAPRILRRRPLTISDGTFDYLLLSPHDEQVAAMVGESNAESLI